VKRRKIKRKEFRRMKEEYREEFKLDRTANRLKHPKRRPNEWIIFPTSRSSARRQVFYIDTEAQSKASA
jgi:hypothetical protein